ncbi:MAG: YraN family protein [Ruminococcaceae bacterium]|nr:YraN family protein [Oscillospiraceae bacterium]
MEKYNKVVGNIGEEIAVKYFLKNKYKILERNYVAGKGEIDIIARKKKTIIFVEVKTRQNENFGTPAEAVDYRKKKKIIETAEKYIYDNKPNTDFRFDVVEVYGVFTGDDFEFEKIEHIEDAFGVNY